MRLNPPSIFVFLISVVLAALALISKFGAVGINVPRYLPHQEYWPPIPLLMSLLITTLPPLLPKEGSSVHPTRRGCAVFI